MKKVLITGGAGFIGHHLAALVAEREYSVDLLDNFSRGAKDRDLGTLCSRSNIRFIECDILDPQCSDNLSTEYDYIYHLAGIVGVSNVLERPYAVLRDNIKMLMNMLVAAGRQKRLKRFVFASTSEVYAGTLNYFGIPIPTPEETPLSVSDQKHPRTSYMLSKIYGEALCHQSGIPFTIIRPHNIYGPRMGMAHVIPELLQRVHSADDGGELEVYSVDHSRAFCYVTDAVKMIRLSAEVADCQNETLNIGSQAPEIRIGDLAALIIEIVGKKLSIKPLPSTLGSPVRRCPDMSKTTRLTGYSSQIPLREGIEHTYHWYKEEMFRGLEG